MSEEFLCANCGCPKYEFLTNIYIEKNKTFITEKHLVCNLVSCVNCNVVSAIKT